MANVAIHHWQIIITIRHYTLWLSWWVLFSVLEMPATVVFVDYWIGGPLLHRQINEIFYQQFPKFASIIVLCVAIVVLPIYMFKVVRMLLIHPNFSKY